MSAFTDRIYNLLELKNKSAPEMVQDLGIAHNSVYNWKRRSNYPSADICVSMSKYLNTTVEYLITGKDSSSLSQEERKLLNDFNSVSPEYRQAVSLLLRYFVMLEDSRKRQSEQV